jgi:hypothetical protein
MISNITTTTTPTLATDGLVNVASATGITGPGTNKTTRTNIWIDRECMEVSAGYVAGSLAVSVVRGVNGTIREFHCQGQQVWVGAEIDFTSFTDEGLGLGLYSSLTRALETTVPTTAIGTATLLESQLLGGLITGTPVAAANYTLPTAAALVAALGAFSNPFIGQSFYFTILNTSAGANTITVVAGAGGTVVGTATVAQNNGKRFRVVLTAVVGTPTYNVYSEGTFVF